MSAQIIGSVCSFMDDVKSIEPYYEELIAGVKAILVDPLPEVCLCSGMKSHPTILTLQLHQCSICAVPGSQYHPLRCLRYAFLVVGKAIRLYQRFIFFDALKVCTFRRIVIGEIGQAVSRRARAHCGSQCDFGRSAAWGMSFNGMKCLLYQCSAINVAFEFRRAMICTRLTRCMTIWDHQCTSRMCIQRSSDWCKLQNFNDVVCSFTGDVRSPKPYGITKSYSRSNGHLGRSSVWGILTTVLVI